MRILSKLLWAIIAGLTLPGAAWAASGTALAVNVDAHAEQAATIRSLTVGADLLIGDRVVTDQSGLVQIRFSDDTLLAVGPNSALVLEDYLLRDDGSVGKFAVNALSGAFRFITGTSRHDDYRIRTPTGTVTVRGTAFDLFIEAGGTRMLMYRGATDLCSLADDCVAMDNICQLGRTDGTAAEVLGQAEDKSGAERDALRAAFPFAEDQARLLPELRLPFAPDCRLEGP